MRKEESREPGSLHFHYDREEREDGLSKYVRQNLHTTGFLRRNRSLAITLIDLAVLVPLVLIFVFFIRSRPGPELYAGYELRATASRSGDRIFVAIEFERTEESVIDGFVRISLRVLPDDRRVELVDALPEGPGERRTIRGMVESTAKEPRLFATIDLGEQTEVVEIEVVDDRSDDSSD